MRKVALIAGSMLAGISLAGPLQGIADALAAGIREAQRFFAVGGG